MPVVACAQEGVVAADRACRDGRCANDGFVCACAEDDGVHRVNWWDAPTNPDIWQKSQLVSVDMADAAQPGTDA